MTPSNVETIYLFFQLLTIFKFEDKCNIGYILYTEFEFGNITSLVHDNMIHTTKTIENPKFGINGNG